MKRLDTNELGALLLFIWVIIGVIVMITVGLLI